MSGTQMERRHGLFPDLVDWFGAEFPRFPVGRPTIDVHPIPIEMSDQDRQYVPRAGLPGMDPEKDIRIPVEGDTPTIGAERTESSTEKEHWEFRYRSFRRSVRLPAEIPTDGVEAPYENRILPPVAVSAPHRSGPG
ncbi:Hsp20/alpha crystallin family protein [Streptomyces sp. NPDC048411]|uniref:Hsp20/alpha crystallin family protein n=1 Tax=Streptomyces sp. NPDC048411 TaxID=3157206 RepID=UPI003453CDFF